MARMMGDAMELEGSEGTNARREGFSEGSDDAVSVYLRDIGAIPLLTAAEEVALARCMEQGRRAESRTRDAASEEERRNAALMQDQAAMARRKLIESNLRLVVSIARRYAGRGVPLSDLIEEGNIGLMRATEKFDYHKGYRFSTYATWWIRQAVSRALANQARVVRLPVHVSELIGQVARANLQLSQELGHEPTMEEVAQAVHTTADRVREVLKAAQQPVSLEQPYGDDGDGVVAEVIEDETFTQPAEQVSQHMLREQVRSALQVLTMRERSVISMRYGLESERLYTLEEIGRHMGVTRERIRQIEKEALWKLQHTSSSESLRSFLS